MTLYKLTTSEGKSPRWHDMPMAQRRDRKGDKNGDTYYSVPNIKAIDEDQSMRTSKYFAIDWHMTSFKYQLRRSTELSAIERVRKANRKGLEEAEEIMRAQVVNRTGTSVVVNYGAWCVTIPPGGPPLRLVRSGKAAADIVSYAGSVQDPVYLRWEGDKPTIDHRKGVILLQSEDTGDLLREYKGLIPFQEHPLALGPPDVINLTEHRLLDPQLFAWVPKKPL